MSKEEQIGDLCSYGPYSFRWTKDHIHRSVTDPLRFECDRLGDAALDDLESIRQSLSKDAPSSSKDLFNLLRDNHTATPALSALWAQLTTVPEWVDWAQIERGQPFFYRHAPANIVGFALQGFVGENSGSPGVVEVLVRTGGFSTRVLLRRLLETFQFLLQVTHSLDAIQSPAGAGFATTVRVRLIHASVRRRILRLAKERDGYFDTARHGAPVNTLDSIHSITTFCCNHMWLQLPYMGVRPSPQEIEDYVALWRYLGYLLGVPDGYMTSVAKAKATMESMLVHELRLIPTSKVAGHNFVAALENQPPLNVSRGFIEAGGRVLNGDTVCDGLDFGKPGWYAYACFRGHCYFVSALWRVQRAFPAVDRRVTDFWREMLHNTVIHGKSKTWSLGGASNLDFQYVPRLGLLTGKEDSARAGDRLTFLSRPLELFYFAVFVARWLVLGSVGVIVALAGYPYLVHILAHASP